MNTVDIKEIPIEKAEFAVLDFETTGVSAMREKTIEVGIVKIKDMQIVDTFQSYINPGKRIPYFITDLTGIDDDDVADAPHFEDLIDSINDFIGDAVFVAHNAQFDYAFLKSEYMQAGAEPIDNPRLCTAKLARKLYPDLKSKALKSLVKHFRILHKGVHRGLGDATATAQVLLRMLKDAKEEHGVEKVSELINLQGLPSSKFSYKIMKKKLADDFAGLPKTPGVYFFKDKNDKIIYIGKAKSIEKRVKNYFSNTAARKPKQIVRKASRIGYNETNTELTALLTEAELIKIHDPSFNTFLKDYPRHYFIKVNKAHPYPDLKVSSKFDFDGNDYFGPFSSRDGASKLLDMVHRTFALRECTLKEFKKKRRCYLADIQRCVAPCDDDEGKKLYAEEMEKVYEFLSGHNQYAINRLLNKMKEFSEQQKYEQAAAVRDTVNEMLNQLNKATILSEPVNKANVLIEVMDGTGTDFILLQEGKIYIKDYMLNEREYFEEALDDYYDGAIHMFNDIEEKDWERIKITLSWMVKNRNKCKLYYLKDYESKEDLYTQRSYA